MFGKRWVTVSFVDNSGGRFQPWWRKFRRCNWDEMGLGRCCGCSGGCCVTDGLRQRGRSRLQAARKVPARVSRLAQKARWRGVCCEPARRYLRLVVRLRIPENSIAVRHFPMSQSSPWPMPCLFFKAGRKTDGTLFRKTYGRLQTILQQMAQSDRLQGLHDGQRWIFMRLQLGWRGA